jgi:Holliday junction resolvasome RuvABC endonuclease subunit
MQRCILSIDLGAKTGWALINQNGQARYGMENFSVRKGETNGHKWTKFRRWLTEIFARQPFQAIYYEDVKRHIGTMAAHAYGGFKAMLEAWCVSHNVELIPVGVGTIKKSFTGKGNALKIDMIKKAREKGYVTDDDNTADAIAIMEYAQEVEK